MSIGALLNEVRFGFVSTENKTFIVRFTESIKTLGYDFDGKIAMDIAGAGIWLFTPKLVSSLKK